jgi:hypothetical protein
MHDVSLGITVRDYLTGEQLEATTYEDLRQGLARMFVEELGYPRESLRPRVPVRFPVEGREYSRVVDLAAHGPDGAVLLLVLFSSGECGTYRREALAAARLVPGGPAPLVAVTDCSDAVLFAAADGAELATGMAALPRWSALAGLAAAHPVAPLPPGRARGEGRILYAYSELLYGCCSHAACAVQERGGRWGGGDEPGEDEPGEDEPGEDEPGDGEPGGGDSGGEKGRGVK